MTIFGSGIFLIDLHFKGTSCTCEILNLRVILFVFFLLTFEMIIIRVDTFKYFWKEGVCGNIYRNTFVFKRLKLTEKGFKGGLYLTKKGLKGLGLTKRLKRLIFNRKRLISILKMA
ncbi:hypothetical protein C1645_744652 [Glomus cerebriforme]|uniref:Uncharacterized protein n=1 Tax=Glomus cerebriforme TaxID=658196 RepID=A0A397S951_9GLOM|nr:hypothetical protein C1645_744652 [Glomus cerebriforme]